MRIACVQLEPVFKDVEASLARADALLHAHGSELEDVDLLVLPEMALTGYMFESTDDVEPFAEDARHGRTARWAIKLAEKLDAFVMVGLPERDGARLYNSLLTASPPRAGGCVTSVYRKHFLYDTDKTWATPGDGFMIQELALRRASGGGGDKTVVRVCPAICMDLNPRDFVAPFDAYELATFAKDNEAHVVLCSMAWLRAAEDDGEDAEKDDERGSALRTMSYWVARCAPLLSQTSRTHLVACNRVDTERGTTFAGTSCIVDLGTEDEARPSVLTYAKSKGQALIVADIDM